MPRACTLVRVLFVVALAGCGAKTGLAERDRDARRADAGRDADPPIPMDAGLVYEWDAGPPEVRCEAADIAVTVPHLAPASPRSAGVSARAGIRFADVYVLIDTSDSMSGEMEAMRAAIVDILADLTCTSLVGSLCRSDAECPDRFVCDGATCVADPGLGECVVSLWSGVGRYAGTSTYTYRNLLHVQRRASVTADYFPSAEDTAGGRYEDLYESVVSISDPMGRGVGFNCRAGGVGCPAYREDATRILLAVTDEPNSCRECGVSAADAAEALMRSGIVFAGINSDPTGEANRDLSALALLSGSTVAGRPLVFAGSDSAVVPGVTEALLTVIRGDARWISAAVEDLPDDDGDALLFVDRIEVDRMSPGCVSSGGTEDRNGDGFDDAIQAPSGERACFQLTVRDNVTVSPTVGDQVFLARIVLSADDAFLAERSVCFRVPGV